MPNSFLKYGLTILIYTYVVPLVFITMIGTMLAHYYQYIQIPRGNEWKNFIETIEALP